MSATGREVVDILEKAGALEWFRYTKVIDNTQIPVTVWRFKSSDTFDEAEQLIIRALRQALDHLSGNTSWSLVFSGRNWVLAPKVLRDLEDSGQFRTDGEVIEYLRRTNPSLGQTASSDLVAIAIDFERCLQRAPNTPKGAA